MKPEGEKAVAEQASFNRCRSRPDESGRSDKGKVELGQQTVQSDGEDADRLVVVAASESA